MLAQDLQLQERRKLYHTDLTNLRAAISDQLQSCPRRLKRVEDCSWQDCGDMSERRVATGKSRDLYYRLERTSSLFSVLILQASAMIDR